MSIVNIENHQPPNDDEMADAIDRSNMSELEDDSNTSDTEVKKGFFDFAHSNLNFEDMEKQVLAEALEASKNPVKIERPVTSKPVNVNINRSPVKNTPPNMAKIVKISAAPRKKPFSLASLLANNSTIRPVSQKPVDAETMEGKRDMVAQKDREAKNEAKRECLDKFANMDTALQHMMVNKLKMSQIIYLISGHFVFPKVENR